MYGRLQEEVGWTRLLDRQREAENLRLRRPLDRPVAPPRIRRLAGLVARTARLASRRALDGARALRERRDAVRDVA